MHGSPHGIGSASVPRSRAPLPARIPVGWRALPLVIAVVVAAACAATANAAGEARKSDPDAATSPAGQLENRPDGRPKSVAATGPGEPAAPGLGPADGPKNDLPPPPKPVPLKSKLSPSQRARAHELLDLQRRIVETNVPELDDPDLYSPERMREAHLSLDAQIDAGTFDEAGLERLADSVAFLRSQFASAAEHSGGGWSLGRIIMTVLMFGLPTVIGLAVGWRLLLRWAPDTGYRLRRRLGWFGDTGRLKREMRDLEAQLESRDLPHLRYRLARLHLMFARPGDAAALTASVVRDDPTHIGAAFVHGEALLELGRAGEALPHLRRAAAGKAERDPEGIQLALARAESAAGNHKEAVAAVQTALRLSPDLPEALYVQGCVLAGAGDAGGAGKAWESCLGSTAGMGAAFRKQHAEWLAKSRRRLGRF